MTGAEDYPITSTLTLLGEDGDVVSRRLRIEVLEGPDSGSSCTIDSGRAVVGTHTEADLTLSDPTVSRRHVELRALADGVLVIDLKSKNGTRVSGVMILEALVPPDGRVQLGESVICVTQLHDRVAFDDEEIVRFGDFITRHTPLKKSLELLKRVSTSNATVLIQGNTGTGKELLARAVHQHSTRSDARLVVVDCSAVSTNLLESQLFGHKKGAFTGAINDHVGAFEAASKGSVFLDELGELHLDLQPKLLRALESRTICRVGEVADHPIDVRFIAATNRDLPDMVRQGHFRDDLYYRVAVVKVQIPDLKERPEDIPLLASHYADQMSEGRITVAPATFGTLSQYGWPGNARELRNVIQRAIALAEGTQLGPEDIFPETTEKQPESFHEAKDKLIASFERDYVQALLEKHDGNVSRAAKEAGLSRNALYALMKRVGVQ